MAEDMVLLAAGLRRATPLPRVCLLQYNRVCWATAAASTVDEFSTRGLEVLVAALLSHHTTRPSRPGVRDLDLSGNFLSAAGLAAISPLTACVHTLRLEVRVRDGNGNDYHPATNPSSLVPHLNHTTQRRRLLRVCNRKLLVVRWRPP